ncbi:BglG family transcription antiterminator [Brevibacillus migulae]|uniref:BglG family transcription antiterminator n=1 Tax=Brevibacillus migulae TaxID=1644114 RepID=UPI001430B954|nr:transcription antiterminator [Brevibacillus migulae]
MLLSSRSRELLKVIIDSKQPMVIKDLAHHFKVSERTIKYDLEGLRIWLREHEVPLLSQRNKGIWIDEGAEKRRRLREVLNQHKAEDIFLNQRERVKYIVWELLLASRYIRINDLAEKFSVSRNTIISDLKEVERHVASCQLTLHSKTRFGLLLEGSEWKKRLAMEYVVQGLLDNADMQHMVHRMLVKNDAHLPSKIQQLFQLSGRDLQMIQQVMEQFVDQVKMRLDLCISDRAVISGIIRLCISFHRMHSKQPPLPETSDIEKAKSWTGFALLKNILRRLTIKCDFELPDEEIAFICLPVMGVLSSSDEDVLSATQQQEMYQITTQLVETISALAGMPFYEEPELFAHLHSHLSDRIATYKSGILQPNPLTDEIMRAYPEMFRHVKGACESVLKPYGIQLLDSDIAFLVLHFQAAYDRLKEIRKINALVVCGTGRGTARFLKTHLENEVKALQVVGLCSALEVEKYIASRKVDVIISVLPLQVEIPVIIVHPLPTRNDIATIHQVLATIRMKKPMLFARHTQKKSPLPCTLGAEIHQQDLPIMERMSQEIIFKGFELSQKIIHSCKDLLTEQRAAGLQLHIMLMVNRLTFGSAYTDMVNEMRHSALEINPVRQRLLSVLEEAELTLPPSEIDAILRYFAYERSGRTDHESGYTRKEWTGH